MNILTAHAPLISEIEEENLDFYKNLVGTTPATLKRVNIVALRAGKH